MMMIAYKLAWETVAVYLVLAAVVAHELSGGPKSIDVFL
jgi:hypothetical protein